MKTFKIIFSLILALIVIALFSTKFINRYKTSGKIQLKSLKNKVRIIRDNNGMPYIYAGNLLDAIRAQGFVTAQDRLFQMALTRLIAQGRLSELAGEKTKEIDIRMRTIGFLRNAKKHIKILNLETKRLFQAYAEGVNEFINERKKNYPIELKLSGLEVEPWKIEDSFSIIYFMAWNNSANLYSEILAQLLVDKLGFERAKELFPVHTNPDEEKSGIKTSENPYWLENSGLEKQADIIRMAMLQNSLLKTGSNNWAVSGLRTKSGKPIFANDPHLDVSMLPGPFYPVGIFTPNIRAVGVIVAGIPGIVIGRNQYVAFGITNSYNDTQDLYIENKDPQNPKNYIEGNVSIPFKKISETVKIKDKKEESGFRYHKFDILFTKRGPVVSHLVPETKVDKIWTLRWSPFETMRPEIGLDEFLKAKSAYDFLKALEKVTVIMLNFVFTDVRGNIGWHTTGKIPIRSQNDSTLPYNVKDGEDNWQGFIPFSQMLQSMNPQRGWLGTCNHKTVRKDYPYYISSHFASRYRYERLKELIEQNEKTDSSDHFNFQRDTKNVLAQKIAPLIGGILSKADNKRISELGYLLQNWDFHDSKEKVESTVFYGIYREFFFNTLKDELGEDLIKKLSLNIYFWQERFEKMILEGNSFWFDDITTDKKETMQEILLLSAAKVLDKIPSPDKQKWGDIHRIEFINPVFREGLLKGLFSKGPYSISGSSETLYRAYGFQNIYDVKLAAALRMVVDMSDSEKVIAVLPGGVSSRTFHPHFNDQINEYLSGEKLYWWFSDEMIKKHTKKEYSLVPK